MQSKLNKDTFCIFPFNTLELRTSGNFTPCCKWNSHIKNSQGQDFDILTSTPKDAFLSDEMNKIRQGFLEGKVFSDCIECHTQEKSGIESLRLQGFKYYDIDKELERFNTSQSPSRLELKLGNKCNLSCRICDPYSSYQWVRELADQGKLNPMDFKKFESGKFFNAPNSLADFKTMIPHISELHFFGGEPLAEEEHLTILEMIDEAGASGNIILHYNTNGTVYNKKVISFWEKYKYLHVNFSIDDIDKRFEYERNGARWNIVQHNLQKFKEYAHEKNNTCFKLFVTLSVFNLYYMDEYLKHFNNFLEITFSLLHNPNHYNIKSIPTELKKIITLKYAENILFKEILHYMNESDLYDINRSIFWEKTNSSDSYRKQNFKETFPEIASYFI